MNPLLDVSFVLTDPDFATSFDVYRRTETVGTNGRSTLSTKKYLGQTGVIYPDGDNTLNRGPSFQATPRSITVVCQFALQGEVQGRQPDIVFWMGSHYLVRTVEPYGHFGQGFYEAACSSTDYQDPDFASELTE